MLLRDVSLVGGEAVDARLDGGVIAALAPSGSLEPHAGEPSLDLDGYLLLPAFAEPHTHLDKALTADRFDCEFTELMAAVEAWENLRKTLTVGDIAARARRMALMALAHGVTAIRTHADVGQGIELRAVEALVGVREELRDLVDIQVVALAYPVTGRVGPANRRLLREALELGADIAGGAPHVDEDPVRAVEIALDEAVAAGRPVDLHADENLLASSIDLTELIARVGAGFPHAATASHCVSLGMVPAEVQAAQAAAAAESGVSVVTCPIANLYLQGRSRPVATPRGLTALHALRAAGVTLAGGGDNIQDCFVPVGNGDPLRVAQYLVVAGQLAPSVACELVTTGARAVMGLEAIAVEPGAPADLVAVRAGSLGEAVAGATPERLVFRRGELVVRTRIEAEGEGVLQAATP